jgi:hypothetical protein
LWMRLWTYGFLRLGVSQETATNLRLLLEKFHIISTHLAHKKLPAIHGIRTDELNDESVLDSLSLKSVFCYDGLSNWTYHEIHRLKQALNRAI